jgi:hypothetical protein
VAAISFHKGTLKAHGLSLSPNYGQGGYPNNPTRTVTWVIM